MTPPWKRDRRDGRSPLEPLPREAKSGLESFAPFRDHRIALFHFALLGLGAWTANALVLSDHGLLRLRELRAEETVKEAQKQDLTGKIDELERGVKESKQQRQERMAREKYRQSRSDEILYLFDRSAPAAAESAAADSSAGINN